MSRQESTAVVGASLADVEAKLSHVEAWSQFLVGLESVDKLGHGRYRFHIRQGNTLFDIPIAVTADVRDHRFAWHCLEGPKWDGELRMAEVEPARTRLHLVTVTEPRGFVANVAEMVGSSKDGAILDLQRLETMVRG